MGVTPPRPAALAIAACVPLSLASCPETPHSSASTAASFTSFGETGDEDDDGAEFFLEHRTYFIGESKKFDGPEDCSAKNLDAVTATLRDRLDDASWSGLRFVDDNSWPEDFWEASLELEFDDIEPGDGLDDLYGDAARLSIYAGHGNIGAMQWGRPGPAGKCWTNVADHTRFGRLAGDRAAAIMFVTSCTLHEPAVRSRLDQNASRQFLGFHDSPYVSYDELRKVFKRTQDGQSTANAWLDEMEDNGAPGRNSPIVATYATTFEEAQAWFDDANLASGSGYSQNVTEPPEHLYYEWLDNKCECDWCESGVSLPEVTIGDTALVLEARRPRRSAEQLGDRALALVGLLQTEPGAFGPPPSAWTSAGLTIEDVTYTTWSGEPTIELSYDPTTDLLTLVDRAALLRARPQGPDDDDDGAPTGESSARAEAERVWAAIAALALDGDDTLADADALELELVRKAGFWTADEPDHPAIAFEYLFGAPRRIAGLRVGGARVRVGVTRLGELSRIEISALEVEIADVRPILRSPPETLAAALAKLEAEHDGTLTAVAGFADVGWALAENQGVAVLEPSLLLEYSMRSSSVVSRRVPVAISLTDAEASMRELAASGPDDGGDPRPPR